MGIQERGFNYQLLKRSVSNQSITTIHKIHNEGVKKYSKILTEVVAVKVTCELYSKNQANYHKWQRRNCSDIQSNAHRLVSLPEAEVKRKECEGAYQHTSEIQEMKQNTKSFNIWQCGEKNHYARDSCYSCQSEKEEGTKI